MSIIKKNIYFFVILNFIFFPNKSLTEEVKKVGKL